MNREELIERTARLIHQNYSETAWADVNYTDRVWAEGTARKTLAVFEQAHTANTEEREELSTIAEPEGTLRDAAGRVAGWIHALEESNPVGAMSLQADDLRRLVNHARHIGQGEPVLDWQWCYVEKWADGSGAYDRVTFDTLPEAHRYLRENARVVAELNAEASGADRIVATIEKRRVTEPGPWLSVNENDTTDRKDGV